MEFSQDEHGSARAGKQNEFVMKHEQLFNEKRVEV
jgi:hypothetical protein